MEKGSTINSLETRRRKPPLVALIAAMLLLGALGTTAVYFITRAPVETPAEDWITHDSSDGAFQVKLPDQPELKDREVAEGGDPIHMVTVNLHSRVYSVAWSDYSEHQLEEFGTEMLLDYAVDGGILAVDGVVTKEVKLEWDGHPARELWADLPGGKAHYRILLVGRRLYRQAIIRSPSFEANDELFFGSFTLK